ncbi:MAG: hypothetical protein AB3X44_17760 [Leptothrix sp. (in: b-proteobacteria)]
MKIFSSSIAWLAFSLTLLVSACGGGGGSSNSAGSDVSIRLSSPASVQVLAVQGMTAPNTLITGTASGNLQSLAGKIIYVQVVDPDQLFKNPPSVSVTADGRYTIALMGNTLTKTGNFSGNIQLYVCLDPACSTQLGNSPLALPYNVTVEPGLVVDTTPIAFTSQFGDPTQTRTLTVTLPKYLTNLGVSVINDAGTPLEWVTVMPSGALAGETSTLTLTVPPAAVGNYSAKLTINAGVNTPSALSQTISKTINLSSQVGAGSNVNGFFSPSSLALTRTQGDPLLGLANIQFVPRDGTVITSARLDYLSAPAAAAGHPMANNWFTLYVGSTVQQTSTCLTTISGIDCLPAGTYTAQVVYDISFNGVASELTLPITLTIESR